MFVGNQMIPDLQPLWPEAPRYSQLPFPSYRFVPGLNPHPSLNRGEITVLPPSPPSDSSLADRSFRLAGRSKSDPVNTHSLKKWSPDQWQKNETYLFGIDLYHQGYLWESHEAWEELWQLTDRRQPEAQFLQGLIQNSAAQLKIHTGQTTPAKHLSHEAWERLKFVLGSNACDLNHHFMGIDISKLLMSMESHYQPLWMGQEKPIGNPPRLILFKE